MSKVIQWPQPPANDDLQAWSDYLDEAVAPVERKETTFERIGRESEEAIAKKRAEYVPLNTSQVLRLHDFVVEHHRGVSLPKRTVSADSSTKQVFMRYVPMSRPAERTACANIIWDHLHSKELDRSAFEVNPIRIARLSPLIRWCPDCGEQPIADFGYDRVTGQLDEYCKVCANRRIERGLLKVS